MTAWRFYRLLLIAFHVVYCCIFVLKLGLRRPKSFKWVVTYLAASGPSHVFVSLGYRTERLRALANIPRRHQKWLFETHRTPQIHYPS